MTLKKEGIVSGCAIRAKLKRPSEPDETAAVWLCCELVRESTVKEILNDQVRSILALPNEAFVKARAPLALGFGVSKAWTGAKVRMTVATGNRQFSDGQYAQQATLR